MVWGVLGVVCWALLVVCCARWGGCVVLCAVLVVCCVVCVVHGACCVVWGGPCVVCVACDVMCVVNGVWCAVVRFVLCVMCVWFFYLLYVCAGYSVCCASLFVGRVRCV